MMSRMMTSGASKPNGAGLPMFSLRMRLTLGLQPRRVIVHRAADLVQDVPASLDDCMKRTLPRVMPGGHATATGGWVTFNP